MNKPIQDAFDTSLKTTDFKDILTTVSEVAIDSVLDDEVIKSIPIVSTFRGILKIGVNVKDRLFLKKILSFLFVLKDISVLERSKMIEKIDNSKEYRTKVGERLLYIIDSCDDWEHSDLVAQLFKAFVQQKISYDDFLRSSNIVKNTLIEDLKFFCSLITLDTKILTLDIYESKCKALINTGLLVLEYENPEVRIEENYDKEEIMLDGRYHARTDGGGIFMSLSAAGIIIKNNISFED